jgi:Fic family protein
LFEPNYKVTEKILNNLTSIASAREIIEQSSLVPKWEASLRRQALLHNTHSSTAIEGNKLTLEQVEALSQGKEVTATYKDKQEVINYLEALRKVPDFARPDGRAGAGTISRETLLEIHGIITRKVLDNPSDRGVFRNRQVYVGKHVFDATGFHEEIVYMPPETERVPGLIDEFLEWLNSVRVKNLNPVLLAGIEHYEIARIHPFIDGNGRTARLLATLILYLRGFDHRQIFALDDYYDQDRKSYYAALATVDKETRDLTRWLEYFTTGVVFSVNRVKEAVFRLRLKDKKGSKNQIALTSRQMKIVELINSRCKNTKRDLQVEFKISSQAVHKDLHMLVKLKVIKPQGQGRSLFYILA